MRVRFLTPFVVLAAVAVCVVAPARLAGQTPATRLAAGTVPRAPDGHPDLQGTYDLATLTPLVRPAGTPLALAKEEAAQREKAAAERSARADAPIDANRKAPPTGGDGSPGPYGNVGGYNNFWLDPGTHYTLIDGQPRASPLIDPTAGRI